MIDIQTVKQVYSASREGCRCGCKGKYYTPGGGDRMINKVVALLNQHAEEVEQTEGLGKTERIYNYTTPAGHVYTAYCED